MEDKKAFLGTAPVGKLLLRLALPTVVAQLINMLYNVVDRIFIGHIPEGGDMALTGVGVGMPLILIVSAFSSLCCSGGSPRASIFMGRGDDESAENTMQFKNDKHKEAFTASLPCSGESGTLKSFLRNTELQGKVCAKSGTIGGTKNFAGYIYLPDGRVWVFAIMVNSASCKASRIQSIIEEYLLDVYTRNT